MVELTERRGCIEMLQAKLFSRSHSFNYCLPFCLSLYLWISASFLFILNVELNNYRGPHQKKNKREKGGGGYSGWGKIRISLLFTTYFGRSVLRIPFLYKVQILNKQLRKI
jgi:hypothetical protein